MNFKNRLNLFTGQLSPVNNYLTENKEYYIDSVLGDDSNIGSEEFPFKTIQQAIDITPKNLDGHYLWIYLKDGTYTENIVVTGFYGDGGIWIGGVNGNPDLVLIEKAGVQIIDIRDNYTNIFIQDISVRTLSHNSECFRFYFSNGQMYNVKVGDNNNTGTIGILAVNSIIDIDTIANIDTKKVAFGYSILASLLNTTENNLGDITYKDSRGISVIGNKTVELDQDNIDSKYLSINEQADSYILTLLDVNKLIEMNKDTAVTLTIPKNSSVAFPIGTHILVRQKGAGVITITPVDGDVILNNLNGLITVGRYAMVTLLKVAENTWQVFGDLET